MEGIVISNKGLRRFEKGHPWIFESDLRQSSNLPQHPAVVTVLSEQQNVLGQALYNPRSKIALRLLLRGKGQFDEALIASRLEAAFKFREQAAEGFEAFRIIHSEADGLPGLTVDKYSNYLVFQQHAAALEPFLPFILEMLIRRYRPKGILARNDADIRELEGLSKEVNTVYGEVPETIPFKEGQVTLFAKPYSGQKTGAFLDQRENHVFAAEFSRGKALDVFSYHGGFALQLALQAESVLALDSSAPALEQLEQAARLNQFGQVRTLRADAFEGLRQLLVLQESFDTIVLDPPAFAKGRSQLEGAKRGYHDINLQAFKLLKPGGRLITASCSYHLDEASFYAIVQEAAADAARQVRVLARRSQAACHPELLAMPETHYLKLLALEVVDL